MLLAQTPCLLLERLLRKRWLADFTEGFVLTSLGLCALLINQVGLIQPPLLVILFLTQLTILLLGVAAGPPLCVVCVCVYVLLAHALQVVTVFSRTVKVGRCVSPWWGEPSHVILSHKQCSV